ncbi:MAG: hypothetical protein H6507_10730 [Calditrichaeota bacterium]|nr:hypothetical protein [Calditrichota bacterium]
MSRVLFIVLLACASSFAATWETMPGASRAINSGLSASRDATFPSWQYLPRETRTGGADFGFGAIYSKRTTLRLGFHGMLELESDNDHVEPYPGEDHSVNLWRGVFGFSTMFALDRLGEKTFGQGGNIEFGFSVRHESDHGYDDLWFHIFGPPDVGNFVMPEAAVRIPLGKASFDLRAQDKVFFGDSYDKSYTHGPGAELIARWRFRKGAYPFMSHYWEYLIGELEPYSYRLKRKTPDNQYYRSLVGIVLPGKHADLALYSAMMAGNQKGLQEFKQQFTWGWGLRIVLFGSE